MNRKFMQRAVTLARRGIGLTSPNPAVGAVIVKGGKIVAEGWHKKAGTDHAEIVAINKMMKKSGIVTLELEPMLFHNAELYVTLEPCSHYGATPPCARAIVDASFKKVYVGMSDPSNKVNGKGIKYMRKHGVDVDLIRNNTDISTEVRGLNQPFIKHSKIGMPYVTLKAGMSLDGKIATSCGDSKWITSENARNDAKSVRNLYDAVIVGAGTVKADDPELSLTGKYAKKSYLKVVIDKNLSTNVSSKIYQHDNVFVAHTSLASKAKIKKFANAGIKVKSFGRDKVSIKRLLKFLASVGVQSVFVEGGSKVHGSFFDATLQDKNIVDEVLFYVAPKLIGGKNSFPVIGGVGADKIKKAVSFVDYELAEIGDNIKVRAKINYY